MTTLTQSSGRRTVRPSRPARRSFAIFFCDAIGWPLAMAFLSTTAIIPLYLHSLGAPNVVIGALPALVNLGYLIPGILVAERIRRMNRALPWLFSIGLCERIPIFVFCWLVYRTNSERPLLIILTCFGVFVLHSLFLGVNQPAYWTLVGKSIPQLWRGRLFGLAGLMCGLLGFTIDPIVNWALVRRSYGHFDGFGTVFLIGAVILLLSFLPFGLLREQDHVEPDTGEHDDGAIDERPSNGIAHSRHFGSLLAALCWSAARGIAAPFFVLSAQERLHLPSIQLAMIVTAGVVGGSIGGIAWGYWGDRRGTREVMLAGLVLAVVSASLACVPGTGPWSVGIAYTLWSLSSTGIGISSMNMIMEFAPSSRDIAPYMAKANLYVATFVGLSPIAGGFLADRMGYDPVFVIAGIVSAVSLCILAGIKDPRHA
jgi:MFS family permease